MRTSVFVMNCDVRNTPGKRASVLASALAVLLVAPGIAPARADGLDFRSGFGITVTGTRQVGPRTVVVDVATAAVNPASVNGAHQVRILLPDGYSGNSSRYPVLYLLHGGAGGSSRQWTAEGGAAEAITAGQPLITVMPDGGKVGWYTDWVDAAGSGPQT